MDIGFVFFNIILSLALYILPYVIIRLIHRKPLSKKAAAIFTITWAILSAVLLICIKFKLGIPSSSSSRSLYWTAVFLGNGLGVDILVHKKKKKVKILPAAEAIASNDPYNVDDVEVNIVNVPGAKQRQQLDRQMKAVISLAVVAFIIAAIAAGFAIYKNAECRQLRSEKNAVQRSLNTVNTQYDDLKEKYDSEIKDREFMFSSNSRNVLELAFYERYIVCTNDEKYYHQYSCKDFTETKSFRVFTKDDAKRLGYKPCPKCFKN